jgi:hypothetical protein
MLTARVSHSMAGTYSKGPADDSNKTQGNDRLDHQMSHATHADTVVRSTRWDRWDKWDSRAACRYPCLSRAFLARGVPIHRGRWIPAILAFLSCSLKCIISHSG